VDDGAGDPIVESRGAGELRRLCRAVVEELGFHGATVTVMASDGSGAAEAASDDDIGRVDQLQFVLGEGPSGDAYASGRPVLVSDLAATGDRWMAFTADALAELIGAIFAFPLQYGAVRLGVLTCYSSVPRALTAREVARCLSFAEAVRDLLLDAVAEGDGAGEEVPQALRIRREVYQAQGMLMVELGISLTEALTRLRAMAFSEGVDINELASDLANRRRPMPTTGDGA
jgi:GAF domain-containing protein/ANTAR domain-containing protein